jgi:hypothetical protein
MVTVGLRRINIYQQISVFWFQFTVIVLAKRENKFLARQLNYEWDRSEILLSKLSKVK